MPRTGCIGGPHVWLPDGLVQSSSDDSGEAKVRQRATKRCSRGDRAVGDTRQCWPSIPQLRLLPQGNGAAQLSVVEKDGAVASDGFHAGRIHDSAAPQNPSCA